MHRLAKIGIGTATVAAALGTTLLSAPAAQAAGGSYEGCPRGAVCVYPGAGWNNGHPEKGGVYWSRGPHNLSHQKGVHRVFNNQYGGWYATLNKGYNGKSPNYRLNQGWWVEANLTPINSISLHP